MKRINKVTAAVCAFSMAVSFAVLPAAAENDNLLTAEGLIKADANNGTDVSETFSLLTDGDITNTQTIARNGSTNTYYAVYEIAEPVARITAYAEANAKNGADIIVYGSNDNELELKSTPPAADLGWDGDGGDKSDTDFKNTYGLDFIANAKNGEKMTENGIDEFVTELTEPAVYKYIVLLLSGWPTTNISEIVLTAEEREAPPAVMSDIYVSASAAEDGDGSIDRPYRTLEEARDAVRLINDNMTGDITVHIMGGVYELDDTFELTPEDSGSGGYKIRYVSDEGAVLRGGHRISGEWTNEGDGIYSIPLERSEKLRSLYVNGSRAYMTSKTVSGRGGYGEYKIEEGKESWAWESGTTPAGTKLDMDKTLLNTRNQSDIDIESRMTWNTSFLAVDSFKDIGGGQMAAMLQMPYGAIGQSLGSNCSYGPGKEQTIYNVFEWLDEPGEFYFDRAGQRLYYYPREGEDINEAEVVVPSTETLVRVKGDSLENRVHDIAFSGLTFENTDWNLYKIGDSSGRVGVQGDIAATAAVFDNFHDSIYRGFDTTPGAVEFESAASLEFTNNTIRNTGNGGLTMVNDVTNVLVEGNVIYGTGASGIVIGHPQHMYIGDKNSGKGNFSEYEKYDAAEEGACSEIDIYNNYIYNSCELFWGCSAVMAFVVSDMDMQYNHIELSPYSGISLGWGWWNMDGSENSVVPGEPYSQTHDNTVMHNTFIDSVWKLADSGAIYTLGDMPGTEISENFIKGIGQPDGNPSYHIRGIHTDEGTKHVHGAKNVIELDPAYTLIDCGNWGGGAKGPNEWEDNYSTSSSYTSTGNYEPGTVIKNHHTRRNGLWEKEVFDIIRESGIRSEYFRSMPDTFSAADAILPTDFLIESGTELDLKINGTDIDGEIWLAPEGTEAFEESDTMSRAEGGKISVPTADGEYRLYYVTGGDAEMSCGKIATRAPEGEAIYWAEDMDISNIGSGGSLSPISLGTSQNTDGLTAKFGITADGTALPYSHVNALDSSGDAKWRGYVEKNIERDFAAGTYTLYIMCDTHRENGAERLFELTVNGESAGLTETVGKAIQYSTSKEATLYILPVRFTLEESCTNMNIKLQAPDGHIAPNFIAMYLEEPEIIVETTKLTGVEGVGEADENRDAVGFYVENATGLSGNLKDYDWLVTMNDDTQYKKGVNIDTAISGEGGVSFGLILTGTIEDDENTYGTSDIESVVLTKLD